MKNASNSQILVFSLLLLLISLLCLGLSLCAAHFQRPTAPVSEETEEAFCGVVLDAGHGGEDCGAISAHGYLEKEINLSLCLTLEAMLGSNGIPVVMTRSEDVLLYDKSADYKGRKKALDLLARKEIGQANPDSLFVSIHMNSYPLPQYQGLQVWYSGNHPTSLEVAKQIQSIVASSLQPENDRSIKEAGSGIYLLHHLSTPAVLVECGFLSNDEEAERLTDPAYQRQLAFLISLAIAETKNQG